MCSQFITIGIGIVFILGGLSGELVLRGTSSGPLLALVGLIMVIYGLFRIASISRKARAAGPEAPGISMLQPVPVKSAPAVDIKTSPVPPATVSADLPDARGLSIDEKTLVLITVLQTRRQEVRKDSNSITVENMDRYLKNFPITEAELLGIQQRMDAHKEKLITDQEEPAKIAQFEQMCGLLQEFKKIRFRWSTVPTPK